MQIEWHGLYAESWGNDLVPEAYAHPAKYSRGLIRQIYVYMLAEGMIAPGDVIGDPFGGVALGARDAAWNGLTFTGVELELRFSILALKNILLWAEKEWCTCGNENQTYLRLLREVLRERIGRSKQKAESEVRPVLQHSVQQQASLFGEGIDPTASRKTDGQNALEQRQAAQRRNESENIGKSQDENRRKKSELEGREDNTKRWIYRNQGERPLQDGTRSDNGKSPGKENEPVGSGAPYQREQAGQQAGKSSSNDGIGTYETPQPERPEAKDDDKDLRDMRENVHWQAQSENVQRWVQAREAAAILAKARRKTEGKFCANCMKAIVQFPVLVQGDSRRFAEIVGGLGGVVSSPPFNNQFPAHDKPENYKGFEHVGSVKYTQGYDSYGSTPGQLGSMPTGNLDAAISSPPYADTIERGDGPGARFDPEGHPGNPTKISSAASYGTSAGQVGRLDGCVTSPPFEAQQSGGGLALPGARHNDGHKFGDNHGYQQQAESDGNLANDTGDTFWTASRAIVEQVYLALKPGGYVAWVTGDFVRKGKRVHFGQQWLALCEAVGFEAVAWAVAWKTEHHGVQRGIFGDVEKRKDRVSFFRRLANEKNPDAAILNEDVIFMQKPLSNDGEVAQ